MLLNNKQLKYFNLNTNDKTDGTKWNIPSNYNFSQKAKMALVSVNNATDSNLNFVFCPTIKNNYFSSLNTSPLIYAGIGYNNQNIINEKQYYDVNGAFLNEIELKTYSSAPQNDLNYNYPQIPNLSPDVWYKFNGDLKESLGNTAIDFAPYTNLSVVNKNEVSLFNSCIKTAGAFPLRTLWNTTGLTMSFWIYLNSTEGASEPILSFYSNTNSSTSESWYYVRINKTPTNNIFFQVRSAQSPGGTAFTTPIGYPLNSWIHISWSFSTSSVWNIYINGELVNDTTSRTIANVTWDNFFIGRGTGPDSINTSFATQKVKDMRFYKKVLTQDEVSILATNYFSETDARRLNYPILKNEVLKLANPADNDPNIHTIPNLWLKFDTGALTINSGTDSITLTNLGGTNAGVSMRGNNSIAFNGTNQYFEGTIAGIANNSFSISFWSYVKVAGNNVFVNMGNNNQTLNNILTILTSASGANLKYNFNFWINDCITTNDYNDVNSWIYLTFTYNTTTKEKSIYRNGVKLAVSGGISNGNYTGTNLIYFGVFVGAVNWLNGYLDDVRIYTGKVLNQEEITRIYNGAKTNYTTQITEPTIGQDLTPNLWLKFDTGALTTNSGSDTITITNDGSAINAGVSVRGNDSVSLNGSTQYLNGTIEGIANNSWSVSAWLYSKTYATETGVVLCFGNESGAYKQIAIGYSLSVSGAYTHTDGNSGGTSAAFLTDINNWVHIVWMYDAITKTRYIYRNGIKLELAGSIVNGQPSPNNTLGIGKFRLGNYYFNGYIDDLRVYVGTILSQQQINDLYQNNNYYILPTTENKYSTIAGGEILNGYPVYPIMWYKFENPNFIGLDSMGKAHLLQDGTFPMTTYDANSFIIGNGSCKIAQGQTLKAATYNFNDIVDAFTLCFWIKITGYTAYSSYDIMFHANQPNFYIARNAGSSNIDIGLFGSGYVYNTHFNGQYVANSIWKHFTIIAEKSGTATKITSYLNGIFNATSTTGTWSIAGITPLNISVNSLSMIGNMDDVRFYNKVLKQVEINDIYNFNEPRTQYQFEVVDDEQKIISHY